MAIETTADRLKSIMRDRGLRQSDILELAKPFCKKYHVKLGKSDLSQFVNGKVSPGRAKLMMLGLALNVSEAWLMGHDVPMSRSASDDETIQLIDAQNELFDNSAPLRGVVAVGIGKYLTETEDGVQPTFDEIPDEFRHKTELAYKLAKVASSLSNVNFEALLDYAKYLDSKEKSTEE